MPLHPVPVLKPPILTALGVKVIAAVLRPSSLPCFPNGCPNALVPYRWQNLITGSWDPAAKLMDK